MIRFSSAVVVGCQRAGVFRRDDARPLHAIEKLSGCCLQNDVVAFANILQDTKVVSRCPAMTQLPFSPGMAVPARCPGPRRNSRCTVAFYNVKFGVQPRNFQLCESVSAIDGVQTGGLRGGAGFGSIGNGLLEFTRGLRLAGARIEKIAPAHEKADKLRPRSTRPIRDSSLSC